MEKLLKMRSKYGGELSKRYPVLASMKITREMERMDMEVLYLLREYWEGGQ